MRALDFDALGKALNKGVLRPVYYLHGDEDLLKDEAVRSLVDAGVDAATRDFNLDRRRAPELAVDDFDALVHTPPMMAARRCVIVTEVEWLQSKKARAQALRAAVLAYASQPSPDTLLVLVQSAADDRSDRRERILAPDPALARVSHAVTLDPLPPEEVAGWIRREAARINLTLEDAAVAHLQATVGSDLPVLRSELAKLASATGGRSVSAGDVADLVGVRFGETVHDFVDAVSARRAVHAATLVPQLLEAPGSSAVRLLATLATTLVGTAYARALLDEGMRPEAAEGRVFAALQELRLYGLRNWRDEARRWTRDAERWTSAELDAALDELLRADRRLKHTAVAGGAEILQEALLAMAGQAAGAA